MNWINITEADVLGVVNEAYLSTWRETALAVGQGDPMAATINDVVLVVRGHCASQVTLGPVGTIPEMLKSAALDLIKVRLPRRLNLESSPTDMAIEKSQMDLLKNVSLGTIDSGGDKLAGTQVVSTTTRTATRKHTEGLL